MSASFRLPDLAALEEGTVFPAVFPEDFLVVEDLEAGIREKSEYLLKE